MIYTALGRIYGTIQRRGTEDITTEVVYRW